MGSYDTTWYCNAGDQATTGYYAVAKRQQNAAVVAGQLARQFTTPAVGSERVFVCIVAGTTANTTDATWTLTRGSKTVDGTATWMECTGLPGLNGDAVNTLSWAQAYAIGGVPALGSFIKRNSGTSYHICTTAGSFGASEPAFSDTAGTVANVGTSVWTSLGPVGNFTGGQAPHARLANAFGSGWLVGGDTVYIGNNHAESQGSQLNIQPSGSTTLITKYICFDASAGHYPPTAADLTTGATLSATGNFSVLIAPSGSQTLHYFYGLTFRAGVGSSSQLSISLSMGSTWAYFDRCSMDLATTGSTGLTVINVGQGTHGIIVFNNTTVKFGHIAQRMSIAIGNFTWQNTGNVFASGSVIPTNLLANNTGHNNILFEALDLSLYTGTIFYSIGSTPGSVLIKDCKLHPTVTPAGALIFSNSVQLVRSSA